MEEVRVIAPTGSLGYGFSKSDFERAVVEYRPHVIAVDAGSTDPGPYYLGAGKPFTTRTETKAELAILIEAALRLKIPLIVGSSGGAGARAHVEWTKAIVQELAAENAWSFSLATIGAELDRRYVGDQLTAGNILTFESDEPLTQEAIEASATIVAQMGPEPIIEALRRGAQVILAGRACDDAVIAAYPIFRGFDRGLAIHMGKILECGALAAEPIGMDVMLGTLRDDHFDVVPGSAQRACTVVSISAHSLYERENPIIQKGPGGTMDLTATSVVAVDSRTVRVRGTTFTQDDQYLLKLEGVRSTGYRTINVAGVRCPSLVETIDAAIAESQRRNQVYFADLGILPDTYRTTVHVYGRDGVMGDLEPVGRPTSHELGLVIEAVAETQELAHAICHHLQGTLLHLNYPGQFNNAGNLAFLYSPSEIDVGRAYEFSVYHLLKVPDPFSCFRIDVMQVGSAEREVSLA